MSMLADEDRTMAETARVVREALILMMKEQEAAGRSACADGFALVSVALDDVLLCLRGLIR